MSLWKSDIPDSRVKHFSKLFELFVRKRSMHDGLLKFLKQVVSSFRALNLMPQWAFISFRALNLSLMPQWAFMSLNMPEYGSKLLNVPEYA